MAGLASSWQSTSYADQLCDACSSIFADNSLENSCIVPLYSRNPFTEPNHLPWSSVCANAVKGCALCVALTNWAPVLSEADREKSITYWFTLDDQSNLHLRVQLGRNDQSNSSNAFALVEREPHDDIYWRAKASRAAMSTGDPDVIDLARAWLQRCATTHGRCNNLIKVKWNPTRLLDVSDARIKLVEPKLDEKLQYVTLSHCWGRVPFFVLTPDNIDQFRRGVSSDLFPLTFEHFFDVTRRLGFRYCWIDCFCIIQGASVKAQEDWASEASKMQHVYANAAVNIGAAHADNPKSGLHSPLDVSLRHRGGLVISWKQSATSERRLYEAIMDGESALSLAYKNLLHNNVLFGRGWVLQECVLSQKMISFGSDQIYWRCSEAAASQVIPWGNLEYSSQDYGYPFWLFDDERLNEKDIRPWHRRWTKYSRWFEILRQYVQSSLTYPQKDIFRALQGIAEHTATQTDDVYHRGILINTMPLALYWKHEQAEKRLQFPTWHWASCGGRVEFNLHGHLDSNNPISMAPLVYTFMTDACRWKAMNNDRDFWPYLCVIGKTLNFARLSIDSYILDRSSRLPGQKRTPGCTLRTNHPWAYRLLPLSTYTPYHISYCFGLVLRETSRRGIFNRVSTFRHEYRKLQTELASVRPEFLLIQ